MLRFPCADAKEGVAWIHDAGIDPGTSFVTFFPDQPLTRAAPASWLYRLAGGPTAGPHPFTDVISEWQQAPVSWMAESGITTGTSPTTFAPDHTLTRAQLITFLYRYQGEPAVTVDPSTPACNPDNDNSPTTEADSFHMATAGGLHSCGANPNGQVACWGDNAFQQATAPYGRFVSVTAGNVHTCGLREDYGITCWGLNNKGQTDAPSGEFETSDAGFDHTCGLRPNRTIACWGNNTFGQIDAPTGSYRAIDAGGNRTCALTGNRTVTCWGSSRQGESDIPTN